jgi:putative hemolysin
MIPVILTLIVAFAVSAFFTAAELALFSLSESRIRTLIDEGFRGSRQVERLRRSPERTLVLLRLGSAAGDVTAACVVAVVAYATWHTVGLAVAIGLGTALVLLVGELIPTRLAFRHNVRLALLVAPALVPLTRALAPLLRLLAGLTRAPAGAEPAGLGSFAQNEIRQLTAIGHTEGVLEEHENQLIERALRLDETKAWDVMTPRVDIFAWRGSLRLSEIAPHLATVPYSRVPIYGDGIDDIIGVLYVREAYHALVMGQRDVEIRKLARQPLIVPGSISLTRLLREFQTRRIHLALVVDEYGGTDGLLTLEDVLEELVGEIVDETDVAEEPPVLRVSKHEIMATGDADLREINHVFNTAFPLVEHRSLNGYLLEELGRVPEPGEVLERDGVTIEVLEATDTQLLRARLKRAAPVADGATAEETTRRRPGVETGRDETAPVRRSSPVARG